MSQAIKNLWARRPILMNQDRLVDLRADATIDGGRVPRTVAYAARFWLVLDWLWIHRPVITTNHRRAEAQTTATVKGYRLGRELRDMSVPPSAEVRRHAERTTSTGSVLVAVR